MIDGLMRLCQTHAEDESEFKMFLQCLLNVSTTFIYQNTPIAAGPSCFGDWEPVCAPTYPTRSIDVIN